MGMLSIQKKVPSVEELRANKSGKAPVAPSPERRVQELQDEVNRLRLAAQKMPTKAQLASELMDIFAKYKVEPIEELIKLGMSGDLTPDQSIKVWTELAAYRHPKRKAVEMTGSVDMNFTVVVRKFGESINVDTDGKLLDVPSGGESTSRAIPIDVDVVETEGEEVP